MSRTARYAPGGLVYHVLNRGVGRRTQFDREGDYMAFEWVIKTAKRLHLESTLRLLGRPRKER